MFSVNLVHFGQFATEFNFGVSFQPILVFDFGFLLFTWLILAMLIDIWMGLIIFGQFWSFFWSILATFLGFMMKSVQLLVIFGHLLSFFQ